MSIKEANGGQCDQITPQSLVRLAPSTERVATLFITRSIFERNEILLD
jgi:hypothetical protein